MGVFEQFPYTNFHELNLDYLLRKIKKYDDIFEDLPKYLAEHLTPEIIGEVIEGLVKNGTSMQNPFIRYGFITRAKFQLQTNEIYQTNQGACSDGQFIYSYRNGPDDTPGILDKYNMNGSTTFSDWTLEASVSMDLKHGNNLYYNKEDELIYCCPLTDKTIGARSTQLIIINPQEMRIVEIKELGVSLWGIAYNPIMEKWAGWLQPLDGGANPKKVIYFDKDFNILETKEINFQTLSRSGLYGDDQYLYFCSTGLYSSDAKTARYYNKLDIFDWNCNYINTVIIPNIEEMEALFFTNGYYFATFNGRGADGYGDYISALNITGDGYVSGAFYNIQWGRNEIVFQAENNEQMSLYIDEPFPFIEPRAIYDATHLEINFCEDFDQAGCKVILPREYGTDNATAWVSAVLVRNNYTFIQSTRIRQSSSYNFMVTGAYCIRINNTTGEVIKFTGAESPLKIKSIRACNYTQQPNNSFLRITNE